MIIYIIIYIHNIQILSVKEQYMYQLQGALPGLVRFKAAQFSTTKTKTKV
jgi:hypothetical protein